jgi:hypothetical integral membrane protein (TIGR02206 family)
LGNLDAVESPKSILFGPDHLAALSLSILAAYVVVRIARRGPEEAERVRKVLRVLLPLMVVAWPVEEILRGQKAIWAIFPLDLCTFNLIVTVIAIFNKSPRLFECMFFWGLGAFLAIVTPPLTQSFPNPRFLAFFALHALLVCAWAFMVSGLKMQLTRFAWLRVWIYTNALAAVVAVVDVAFDKNYFFLRGPPDGGPTLLDVFGPWPVYLVTANLTMGFLFYLMQLAHSRAFSTAPIEEPEAVSV